MYLRSKNFYKAVLKDQVSVKSSEESISKLYLALTPILEKEYVFDTTSSMSINIKNVDLSEFSMAFNMWLTYVKTNDNGAQLF